MSIVLEAHNLYGGYMVRIGKRAVYVEAISDVSIPLYTNEIVGIAGESGCGKSTLIKMLYGAIEPPLQVKRGSVYVHMDGNEKVDILKADKDFVRKNIWWRFMAYIPQNSMNVLDPTKKIRNSFIDIFRYHGVDMDKGKIVKMAAEYLKGMGLPPEVMNAYPHQLSGGMKQRVVIALSLVFNPRILFADEPTTAVDVVTQLGILDLLKSWQKERKATLVLVSHDMSVHAYLDTKVNIMYAGYLVESGKKDEIFYEPLHPYTQGLIKSLIKKGEKDLRYGLPGEPPDLKNPPPGCRFHPRCPLARDICRREPPPVIDYGNGRVVRCWLYAK